MYWIWALVAINYKTTTKFSCHSVEIQDGLNRVGIHI